MLKPDYFDGKSEELLRIYRELEDYILKDIAGRLLKTKEMSGTADRLLWKLRMMGESREEIQKKLMLMTGLSNKELKAILQDAVLTSWEDDRNTYGQMGINISSPLDNPNVIRVMDAEYKKSQGALNNLTRTTMEQSQRDLMNLLDEVEYRVSSGVQSYSSAVCEVLDRYAGSGIVVYPTLGKNGQKYSMSLEAAVNLIVRTSMNQTAAQVTNQYIKEADTNYVLVSAHYGARVAQKGQPPLADHSAWQGKAYSIRGSEPGFPNLLECTGYDILPDGTGKVTDPLGLHGYNCRHSHQPWDKSLRNPWLDENGKLVIDSEENRKMYENQQKQRGMERAIRKTKRELLMKEQEIAGVAETDVKAILQEDYDKLAYKLRQQNKKYNEFCEENDLQKQSERIKAAGFRSKEAARARGAATRYANKRKEEQPKESHISKSITVEDVRNVDKTGNIRSDVLDVISNTLVEKGAMECYDGIEVKYIDSSDFMITDTKDVGTWCENTLIINSKYFNENTVEKLNEYMKSTSANICESLRDAIIHETYHAKLAYKLKYSQYEYLCNDVGINGISQTALKDLSETIAEVGVLYDNGKYDIVPEKAKRLFERYFDIDGKG